MKTVRHTFRVLILFATLAAVVSGCTPAASPTPAAPTEASSPTVEQATAAPADPTAAPSPAEVATEPASPETVDGRAVCDPLNDFTLTLPDGWYALTPSAEGVMGTTTVTNYTEAELMEAIGDRGQEGPLPAGFVKMDITGIPIAEGTFDALVEQQREGALAGPGSGSSLTDLETVAIAGIEGVRYQVLDETSAPRFVVFLLRLEPARTLSIAITPGEGAETESARAIADGLTLGECQG